MATKKTKRAKVRNVFNSSPRATLIAKHPAPQAPDYWGKTKVVAHVVFDHGLECLVPGRRPVKLKTVDVYERAFANPEGFMAQLREASPLERALLWAQIGLPGGSSMSSTIWDAQGQEQAMKVSIPDRAPRYTALLRKVDPTLAIETVLLCLAGWLDDNVGMMDKQPMPEELEHYDPAEYKWGGGTSVEYANIAFMMMGGVALHISEFVENQGLTALADGLSPELMAEFSAMVKRMEDVRCNGGATKMPNINYLREVANGAMPGFIRGYCKLRPDHHQSKGAALGVVDLDLPVLSN